jgi:hypothetical protein
MNKKSTLVKDAVAAPIAITSTVDQQQVKYKMTTDIPDSITTPDSVPTSLGTLRFFDGFPDDATVRKVYDNLDFQRGVQSFLTAMPAASACAFRTGLRPFGLPQLVSHGEHGDYIQHHVAQHKGWPTGH